MDCTEEYFESYFKNNENKKYTAKQKKYISSLENQLRDCYETKDISKTESMTKLIEEEVNNLEDDESKDVATNTLKEHIDIYYSTYAAWADGFRLSSDDIAATLSQSTQWVTRELSERIDYIRLIKPNIFFSMNFMFNVIDQQVLSKKKYLYNTHSFEEFLSDNLKLVNKRIGLNFNTKLDKEEKSRVQEVIAELERNASSESSICNKDLNKILNKELVLMNISALKQYMLKEQISLNVERMKKKLYLGVRLGFICNGEKIYQENLISEYKKDELNNIKNSTTIYNQQVYRYLDSKDHTKYHLYFNKDKEPLVLYSLSEDKFEEFTIMASVYHENIEEEILLKANIKNSRIQ